MAWLIAGSSSIGAESAVSTPSGTKPRLAKRITQTAAPGGPSSKPLSGLSMPSLTDPEGDLDAETLAEPLAAVKVEGNRTIPAEDILRRIKTRAGRVVESKQIKEDIRELVRTRWFFNVETKITQSPEGPVLVFKVLERPMLKSVEFKSKDEKNKLGKKEAEELASLTGLKPGSAFDVGTNREAARRIESHYREKGHLYVEVELEKGNAADDRDAVFIVDKGPKVHVDSVKFSGNKFVSNGVLKTQVKTKTRVLWLFGGKFDPTSIPEDIASLKQYYHGLGFFDVRIKHRQGQSADKSQIHLEYVIEEGQRYKVRSIAFEGNRVLKEEQLRKDLKLQANDDFNERKLNADVEKITSQYDELGRIFARIEAVPSFQETSGTLDVVYKIEEDRPYRIGPIQVRIEGDHPHTKVAVIKDRLLFKEGDLASRGKLKKSELKLRSSQIFLGTVPGSPGGPQISVAPVIPKEPPGGYNLVRGQDYDGDTEPQPSFFNPQPLGTPGMPELPSFQDQGPGFIDPIVTVQETQTGRIMFGVGINSNAGLVGNAVLEENNFDLFRPPASIQEVIDGVAWRGGGQQFRIEAVPGIQLSRYMVSWRDPYFLHQNFSLGVSGFYYTRFFPNWNEQREGGRVTFGQSFTPYFSGSIALRAENVTLSNPSVPTPQTLADAIGSNFLSTVQLSLAHDTRDSSFLPGKGHLVEGRFEQAYGEFLYPKAELDARQYFTLRERPDGGNRHIFAMFGQLGWTDNQTPIFEKFFAGGFQTFRGFQFYGVTPREFGVRTGGRWQALGSLEYFLPVTADDTIQLVAFTDFGTVENKVTFDNFRVSVGGGVRLTIPLMGPVPIALDLAVPVVKQGFDSTQIFSFNVGVSR